ncbi:IclR family transcriptional regulator [Deinococcus ruber]|uniref:Transcriptional regulator n=1 Tax=Deinococcus ruber TaxID=1848197 RepID=A0A918CHP6_9DEIO|nr:IclR family transcriptional regulator [Deinococcus ruber]GGR25706.1 transcriptional regulator [Deinococcus ruber]
MLNAASLSSRSDQTADKVLSALLHLAESSSPLSAREIAAGISRPLSTTYRYLSVLREWELIAENLDGSGFVLGPRCMSLGHTFMQQFELGRLSLPVLQDLVNQTGETALLLIPMSGQVICVESIESPKPLRYAFQKGVLIRSVLRGASAKAMLPYISDLSVYEALRLDSDLHEADVFSERERIRTQGYAISENEVDSGVVEIAAAILGRGGNLMGAVSVVSPAFRASTEKRESCAARVKEAAAQIGLLAQHAKDQQS